MKSKHEELGPEHELVDVEDTAPLTLESIGQVIEGKLQKVATKECIENLQQTVVAQNEKTQELEAKIVLMEKYIERTEKLEKGYGHASGVRDRIQSLEHRCDENEQYHRRLCLRFNSIYLNEDNDESNENSLRIIKALLKEELEVDIPDMVIDRAHRIGQIKEDLKTKKKWQTIIVRFTTWRHHSIVYRARIKSVTFKIQLDLTQRKLKLLDKANAWLKEK